MGTRLNRKSTGSRKVVQLCGNLRQKSENGLYYYRLTVANGRRKEFALKTSDFDTACKKALELDSIWISPTQEVALAQISAIKGYSKKALKLPLTEMWQKYSTHPMRATPHTVAEQKSYESTLAEFIDYVTHPAVSHDKKKRHQTISTVCEVTQEICADFAEYLKTTSLAVDTHNRKIKRLRRIFDCLGDYYDGNNPFKTPILLRNEREEQDSIVHRQAFTKKQEGELRAVLADSIHKVKNKPELRVIYMLGMYTGQRLKDCVLLQWQNIDMEHKRIWVKQFKTGKEVTIPIAPELLESLKEAESWKCNQYVSPNVAARYNQVNAFGKNIGNNLVDLDVLRVIRWIGLEPSVDVPGRKKKMTIYGFHSLRHSFASFCAEAGVPKAVLLSILGTDSEIADKYYTHVGDESQRKAVEAIGTKSSERTAEEKIHEVLELLKSERNPGIDILEQIRKILE